MDISGDVRLIFVSIILKKMKRDKIIYWVATGLLAAGMFMSAFMYLSKNPELIGSFEGLGFPLYFVSLLGVAKLLGAIVLLAPAGTRLKEWAYAGFIFTFIGAIWTHVATSTPFAGPAVFLVVLGISYYFWTRIRSKEQGVHSRETVTQRREVSQSVA
jgi:hypothetical protein